MVLNKDILEIIFKNLFTFKSAINFRLIDKECNEIFKSYFIKLKVDIIPRSTFINFSECSICYKKRNKLKQFIYNYDILPHKCIIHCDNKDCTCITIKKYLIDIKKNDIYPFCIINKNFFDNNKSIFEKFNMKYFYIDTLRCYNKRWYVKFDLIYRISYLKIKNLKGIFDFNLFSWFLNRKNISKNQDDMDLYNPFQWIV